MIQLEKSFLTWLLVISCAFLLPTTTAFSPACVVSRSPLLQLQQSAKTMEPPTETERKTGDMLGLDDNSKDDDDYGDLEYLIDSSESREMEDPFHILLMGSTFEKPKITVPYVSGSLTYVLDMPGEEAKELSQFAREQGMSCLGTYYTSNMDKRKGGMSGFAFGCCCLFGSLTHTNMRNTMFLFIMLSFFLGRNLAS